MKLYSIHLGVMVSLLRKTADLRRPPLANSLLLEQFPVDPISRIMSSYRLSANRRKNWEKTRNDTTWSINNCVAIKILQHWDDFSMIRVNGVHEFRENVVDASVDLCVKIVDHSIIFPVDTTGPRKFQVTGLDQKLLNVHLIQQFFLLRKANYLPVYTSFIDLVNASKMSRTGAISDTLDPYGTNVDRGFE